MKKFVVFVLLLSAFAGLTYFKNQNAAIFSMDGMEKVCFVSDKKFQNMENVVCGNLNFNYCTPLQAKQNLKEFCQNSQGIQFYFSNITAKELLKKLKATTIEKTKVEGFEVTITYTPYFLDCVFVKNMKANLQLAEKDGKLVAGMPAILTGF